MNPGNSPSDKVQRYIEDFINRYRQRPQGISDEEAANRYLTVVVCGFPPRTTYRRPRKPSPACRPRSGYSSGGTWASRPNSRATTLST